MNRVHRISTCKLIHGLLHTRKEANKLYGTTDKCPCCTVEVKTMNHMLSCSSAEPTQHRTTELANLRSALVKCKTPGKITDAPMHGIMEWSMQQSLSSHMIKPLFRGTVTPVDCLLVQAFQEQTEIGWDQLL
jgi:hypothetical protein